VTEPDDRPPDRPRDHPGLTSFTIEGRTAPALFVVGWLATVLGLGIAVIAVLAGRGLSGGLLFTAGLGLLSFGLIAAAGSQTLERRAAGRAPYAGPSPVLVFAAALPLTIVVLVVVGAPLVQAGLDPDGPPAALISILITALAYVALLRLLVVGTRSLGWREMGLVPSGSIAADLAWGAVLAVPVLFGTGLFAFVLSQYLPIPPNVLPTAPDTAGLAMNLVAAALVAPVAEELFFRGFATTAWKRTDGARAALVRGSLFFAIAHVLTLSGSDAREAIGFAAFAFFTRLPVSFALGWLFLRRGSLWAPIALHGVFNGLQVLALAAAGGAAPG
jgi:membrane protease YdiL (CAAX protease family)